MIRKSMPSGYDPMGGYRFSLATNAERVCAEIMLEQKSMIRKSGYRFSEKIMLEQKIERDDDSKKSHHVLDRRGRAGSYRYVLVAL